MRPLLLVTNDDGIHAPGISALASALQPLGEVFVVAPDREVSACAQSLTLRHPLRAEPLEGGSRFSVDGTPADCVNLALVKLLPRRPDLVLAGINRGANLGEDVFYSGTVGGAREGTFFGVPAIAVSLATKFDDDFGPAAAFAARLASKVLEEGLPPRTLLNVNVPPGQPTRAVVTVQGRREPDDSAGEAVDASAAAGSRLWKEAPRAAPEDVMTDVWAVRSGLISVSPLHTDTTHHASLAAFRAWERALLDGHGRP